MEIITLKVGLLDTNCYLIYDKNSKKTIIIDPGDSADYIERIIQDKTLSPYQILATHGHFDHLLACFELKEAYQIPFYIHKKDEFLVKNMTNNAQYFLKIKVPPSPAINGYLTSSSIIKLGDEVLQVWETPGHTPGSCCFYNKKANFLIAGDLIFADGAVGRTDFSYSDSYQMKQSLDKILVLPSKTIIYPGHGQKTTISHEINYH